MEKDSKCEVSEGRWHELRKSAELKSDSIDVCCRVVEIMQCWSFRNFRGEYAVPAYNRSQVLWYV